MLVVERSVALDLLRRATLVFWDFDGVIKDSVSVKTDGFEKLFAGFGPSFAARVRRHHEAHTGVTRGEKIAVYLGWAGEVASPARIEELSRRFSALVMQAVIDCDWIAGTREYLLANCGRQTMVLTTATPQQEIESILDALDIRRCFAEVFGAPTSKADAIRTVLRRTQCPQEHAVMVGDSDADLRAAAENRLPFLLRRTSLNESLQRSFSGPMYDHLHDE
jgi:phosphoglycolate phosphatase-like HAD superfamily hydrolase